MHAIMAAVTIMRSIVMLIVRSIIWVTIMLIIMTMVGHTVIIGISRWRSKDKTANTEYMNQPY